jgi:hypothetical protein
MTLREWLDKLKNFDPDDWGELEQLRTTFTKEDLEQHLELEITFATKDGIVDQVLVRLFDDDDQAVVDLRYQILQLDSVVLAGFIQEAAFPPDEPSTSS